jgi:hypothetical protein
VLFFAITAAVIVPLALNAGPPSIVADPLRDLLDSVDAARYADSPAVIVFDSTRTEVEETGLGHVNRHVLVKILTDEGATRYSSMRFDYDPASNMVEVKKLKIRKKDGRIEEITEATMRDLPQPQYMIYWGARMKLAEVPGLEPGDAVEYSTYMKGFTIAYLAGPEEAPEPLQTGTGAGNSGIPAESPPLISEEGDDSRYIPPMRGHFYDVVLFESDLPMIEKAYTLVLPKDKPVQSMVYNGELSSSTQFDEKKIIYAWWKKDVPAYAHEPRMVAETDALTKLVLATVPDWGEKSRWFWQVNEPQFGWNADIDAKVKEITKGLRTDDERREALLRWVARQIRYSGISMGKGEGYTLHSGIMTFDDRAGVCKDIAGMLVTMMRTAGYTTYPAMTMAGARVEKVPADQFNHCVVAVQLEDGAYKLYDPTWCPFSREIWSSAEQLQNFVIGSPEGEELSITPYVPPEKNAIRIRAKELLTERGDLEGTLTITGDGYTETNLRWGIVNEAARAARANFEKWLAKASPLAEVTTLEITDPVDLDSPFRITIGYRVPGYAASSDGVLVLTPLLANYIVENRRLNDFLSAAEEKERKYDVALRCTRLFDFEEEIEMPRGFALRSDPGLGEEDGEIASFKAGVGVKGRKLTFREELALKQKIIPPGEYPNFKKAVDLLEEAQDLRLVLSKKGA